MIYRLALCGFLLSAAGALGSEQVSEPDYDRDGVSDYDDYCPNTPLGRVVWTMNDYYAGRVALHFVGCAGNELVDPGYRPPARPLPRPEPRPGNLFEQTEVMYLNGVAPGENSETTGRYTGRCYAYADQYNTQGALLWSERRDIDGPAFPARTKFSVITGSQFGATDFDQMDPRLEQYVQNSIVTTWPTLDFPSLLHDVDGLTWSAVSRREQVRNSMRFYRDYIVVKRTVLAAPPDSREVRHDLVTDYCYFFKRVK